MISNYVRFGSSATEFSILVLLLSGYLHDREGVTRVCVHKSYQHTISSCLIDCLTALYRQNHLDYLEALEFDVMVGLLYSFQQVHRKLSASFEVGMSHRRYVSVEISWCRGIIIRCCSCYYRFIHVSKSYRLGGGLCTNANEARTQRCGGREGSQGTSGFNVLIGGIYYGNTSPFSLYPQKDHGSNANIGKILAADQ